MRNIRPLDKSEIKIIYTTFNQISPNIVLLIENKHLSSYTLVPEHDPRQLVYLISEKLQKIIFSFQNYANIASAGLYIGFLSRNTFFLSLEGADFFLKEKIIPDHSILNVTNKAEKAILYGNPIIKRMIFNCPSDLKKNAIMLVLNKTRELLALARSEIDYGNFKLLNQNDLVAINLIDKGYYLRKKQ